MYPCKMEENRGGIIRCVMDGGIAQTTKLKCSKPQRCAILTIEAIFIARIGLNFNLFTYFGCRVTNWKLKTTY